MRILRKTMLAIGVLLATLILALCGYWLQKAYGTMQEQKPLFGQLEYDESLQIKETYRTGSFGITWDGESGLLSIRHKDRPEQTVWQSLPGQSFVHAAYRRDRFRENRGSYVLRSALKQRFRTQQIASLTADSLGIYLRGNLLSEAGEIGYTLTFTASDTHSLDFAITTSGDGANWLYFNYASEAHEQFFGFGEQFSFINMKGRRLPVFVSEQGIGRGKQPLTFLVDLVAGSGGKWFTSYAPVPHYISSELRSLFLKTYAYSVFDFRKKDLVQISVKATELEGTLLSGDSPASLINAYTRFSGRMEPLPYWLNEGAVIGLQGGTDKVQEIHRSLMAADVPVSAYWLQDWVGQRTTSFGKQLWWNWELDRDHYHHWEDLRDELAADGARVMGYINPFLVDAAEKQNVKRDLFREAGQKDLLVTDSTGEVLMVQITDFSAAILDLTNPAAVDWITDIIQKELLGNGFSGWMADFGEALPLDAHLYDGEANAETYHNRYPEKWSEVNRDAMKMDSSSGIVAFHRSAFTRSPGSARLFWLGDQTVSWDRHDGLRTAVTALLSSGLSGFSLNHSDIGGYTAITNKPLHIVRGRELLMRWIELNAFTAVFRTHEGNRPAENAQIYDDAEMMKHFGKFAKVFKGLAPYRTALMREAAETGLPLVRHPFIHYPEETAFHSLRWEQFLLGEDLMVAPVTCKGCDEVKVFLPKGKWIHLFTGAPLVSDGGYFTIDAPMGTPAVFFRNESEFRDLFMGLSTSL